MKPLARHPLATAFVVAAAMRIAVFILLMIWPIANESGHPVSPLLPQRGIDMGFYEEVRVKLFSEGLSGIAENFAAFYGAESPISMFVSAPIVPLMLELFSYGAGNTLPLATFYLIIGIVLAGLWLRWLHERELQPWLLYLFALLPNPVWLTVNISTDLPFAFLFALIYFSYFRRPDGARYTRALGFQR